MASGSIWLIGIFCFIAGGFTATTVILRLTPSKKKNRDLEKHLNDKQDELKNFQQEVTEHFTKTADLLGELAKSYRDVHNHLASGAQNLCKDAYDNNPILTKLPPVDGFISEEEIAHSQPLDYAPKSTPYDRGMLNEEYGLEKVNTDDEATSRSPTPEAVLKEKPIPN